jgi:hypothetical protein
MKREKQAGLRPDPDVDMYMKVSTIGAEFLLCFGNFLFA